jgi:hypothetical protein
MVFLFGLGVVYAVAYACVTNLLVLWPLLLPMADLLQPVAKVAGAANHEGVVAEQITSFFHPAASPCPSSQDLRHWPRVLPRLDDECQEDGHWR